MPVKGLSLEDHRLVRLLFRLALPGFLGLTVNSLYNVVDTIFIGHYVGPLGVAALSVVFPVQMLASGAGHLAGMGGASIISRALGAKDIKKAQKALGNGLGIGTVLSMIISVIGLIGASTFLGSMGASQNILPYAKAYLNIILVGVVFQVLGISLGFFIRAEGNARIPMMGMISGAVLNIILDFIFIVHLHMGVEGAAIATVISQFVTAMLLTTYYFWGISVIRLSIINVLPEYGVLREILAVGIASFTRTMASSLSIIVINRVLVSQGGDIAVSCFGIISRIVMFAIIPPIVIGEALQPIIGYNDGAGIYHRALRSYEIAFLLATFTCILEFVFILLYSDKLMSIFTNDLALINLGAYAARRIFFLVYLVGPIIVTNVTFQALGKAGHAFLVAFSRSALFLLPSVLILPRYLGLDGVWFSFPCTDLLSFMLVFALFWPQFSRLRSMERAQGSLV